MGALSNFYSKDKGVNWSNVGKVGALAVMPAAAPALVPNFIKLSGQEANQEETLSDLDAAQKNLKEISLRGAKDTSTDEMRNAYKMALDQYKLRQEEAKTGFTDAEQAQARNDISKVRTASLIAGREASGGQMSKYLNTVLNTNQQDSLIDLAAKDAMLKLQKRAAADSQLGNVQSAATSLQSQKNFDTGNYREDLTAAGKAISDLRMQKMLNRQGIYNTYSNTAQDVIGLGMKAMTGGLGGGTSEDTDISYFKPDANAQFLKDYQGQ